MNHSVDPSDSKFTEYIGKYLSAISMVYNSYKKLTLTIDLCVCIFSFPECQLQVRCLTD
jgi:hypothetical protein